MASFNQVRKEIKKAYRQLNSWRKVGKQFGITDRTAIRIAVENQEPKEQRIRDILGLDDKAFRQYRNLYDMPVKVLCWKLEHREEFGSAPLPLAMPDLVLEMVPA